MTVRRAIDLIVAGTGILVTLPLLLAITCAVALLHGRPVLFRQRRVTTASREFRVAKFRTMSDLRDAHGALLPDAQRTTRLGHALRRTRLDELPQLFNVLAGDMSLIGPRPLLPETITAAGRLGRIRCRVRPGITGWAQVNGNALLSDSDKIALDLWYIANRSLVLDLHIVLRTIQVALAGERPDPSSIRRAYESHPYRRG